MANKTYIQEKLMGMPGQVVSFDSNNKAIVKSLDPILGATLYITAQYGAVITASDGLGTLTATNDPQLYVPQGNDSLTTADGYTLYTASNNVYSLNIPRTGKWLVTSTAAGISVSNVIIINGAGDYYLTLSSFNAYIIVTFPMEATCTCSDGTITLTATNTDGFYVFNVPNPGEWTITAFTPTQSKTRKVIITASGQEETIDVKWIDPILDYNDWATIQRVTQLGTASTYWSIGDCKAVKLNGTIDFTYTEERQGSVVYEQTRNTAASFNNQTVYAFILDFDHNARVELNNEPGLTFQIGKTTVNDGIDICLTDGVYGLNTDISSDSTYNAFRIHFQSSMSWVNSWMRIIICGNYKDQDYNGSGSIDYTTSSGSSSNNKYHIKTSFKDIIPTDLKQALKIISRNVSFGGTPAAPFDFIYLPSRLEILGTGYSWENNEQQFTYYLNNSKIKYKDIDNTSVARWWTRTQADSNGNDATSFIAINDQGNYSNTQNSYSYGFAPCFTVG